MMLTSVMCVINAGLFSARCTVQQYDIWLLHQCYVSFLKESPGGM